MEWQQIFIKGEQTLSIYESEWPRKAKKKHTVDESAKPDAKLVAIVRLLARIVAERDYNSIIHLYEVKEDD